MKRSEALVLLAVSDGASAADLKSAYRKQSMRHHPDRNPGDPDAARRFSRVREAYEILTGRRAAADDRSSGLRPLDGADIHVAIEVGLEQAFTGGVVQVPLEVGGACPACRGAGRVAIPDPLPCDVCGGTGHSQRERGIFTVKVVCPACGGGGQLREIDCRACGGSGRNPLDGEILVKLPPGISDGGEVVEPGGGHPGRNGGQAGDLRVAVRVSQHPGFRRRGSDLSCPLQISFADACLGGTVTMVGIDGAELEVSVPPGCRDGGTAVLPGQGMPDGAGGRGTLRVVLRVRVPETVSREQASLLVRWRDLEAAS